MRGDEARDAGGLLGTTLDEVAALTRDVHRAVAGRVFGMLGPSAAPARLLHDAIATVAYGSTRLGVRWIPTAAGYAAQASSDPAAASIHDSPGGHVVLGALNGILGDQIAQQRPALAAQLSLRTHSGPLRRISDNVVHDVGEQATGRVVVLLHGLCESDRFWAYQAERSWGDRQVTYGSLLRDEAGWTPLYANFNSGLHISANGADLARMLEQVVASWPVPVTEIALIGHSMGGLVARSAAHQAGEAGLAWVARLRHVVGLGAPHLGAPLERAVNRVTRAMARLPETRPFARLLNRRSVGIKDLRHGSLLDADWSGFDPDDCEDHCTEVPMLADVAHYAVSATLSRSPGGLLPSLGDMFVDHVSATGNGPRRKLDFSVAQTLHIGARHHFHLLGDPVVYAHLRQWLS